MCARVGLHRVEVGLRSGQFVQVALDHVQAPAHWMHVRVLEPWKQHPPMQVDDLGAAGDLERPDLRVGADAVDPSVAHGHGLGPTASGVHRVDVAVDE